MLIMVSSFSLCDDVTSFFLSHGFLPIAGKTTNLINKQSLALSSEVRLGLLQDLSYFLSRNTGITFDCYGDQNVFAPSVNPFLFSSLLAGLCSRLGGAATLCGLWRFFRAPPLLKIPSNTCNF